MKTFEEARAIAQQWEDEKAAGPSALVGRALLAHINSLASPQVKDEQILQTWSDKSLASDYYPPGYTLKEHVLRFARALLSALPAAEEIMPTFADDDAGRKAFALGYNTRASEEAKPVAADYSGNWKNCPYPHNFGKPLGFAVVTNADTELPFMLDGGAHTFRREAQAVADSKEYAGTHHVIELWPRAAAAQEQVPADMSPALAAYKDCWDIVQEVRDAIGAGAHAENKQHERSVVEPHLDAIQDEIDGMMTALQSQLQQVTK